MTKTAAIYDPYLDTLGGGERYCLTVAEILKKNGWKVDIFWSGGQDIIKKAENRFSLNLKDIHIQPDIFLQPEKHLELIEETSTHSSPKIQFNLLKSIKNLHYRFLATKNYDIFFYLSDGSIPLLFSKKNYLHIQAPLASKNNLLSRLKFQKIDSSICNSKFTASFYQHQDFYKTIVLYPPVDTKKLDATLKKEKQILSVGRFDNILNSKKQDVLITAFKTIHQHNPDWKLILAGGSISLPENNNYIQHLKMLGKNLPISIVTNPDFSQLVSLYQTSSIYWHAAGFGVDQNKNPEFTEHFGMSVVESMAAGCVPVVVNKGGLPEIVTSDFNGYIWDTIDDLVGKTQLLISSPKTLNAFSKQAINDSQQFSKEEFETKLFNIINA